MITYCTRIVKSSLCLYLSHMRKGSTYCGNKEKINFYYTQSALLLGHLSLITFTNIALSLRILSSNSSNNINIVSILFSISYILHVAVCILTSANHVQEVQGFITNQHLNRIWQVSQFITPFKQTPSPNHNFIQFFFERKFDAKIPR